jgi:hypothetical protein
MASIFRDEELIKEKASTKYAVIFPSELEDGSDVSPRNVQLSSHSTALCLRQPLREPHIQLT